MGRADGQGDWATLFGERIDALTLVYARNGEQRIELASDGTLTVREDGGPRRDRGQLLNFVSATVRAWRGHVPAERHAALVGGLRAALAENASSGVPAPSLAMDEVPSSLYVHHPNGRRLGARVPGDLLQGSMSLRTACAELNALCHLIVACRETHSLPNPELDQWPEDARHSIPQPSRLQRSVAWARSALGAKEPAVRVDAGARVALQAALDAYYRGPAFAALGQLQPAPFARASPGQASFVALCSRTGGPVGTLTLRPEGSSGWLSLTGFTPTGNVGRRIEGPEVLAVRVALGAGDLRTLFRVDPEIVPFYCPVCDAAFAASQWQLEQRSATSVAGTCPTGHRRSLCAD